MADNDFTVVRRCNKCGTADRSASGNCKECAKISFNLWASKNKEKAKASHAARYAANREKEKASSAAWKVANKEKNKAANDAWYAANKETVKIRGAAWKAANPEARSIHKRNRRALKKQAAGKISKGLAEKLFILQKGKCPCCGKSLGENYHMDHIIPLALGGSNYDSNIQLLRKQCNLQKNAKHPLDFMQSRGFLL